MRILHTICCLLLVLVGTCTLYSCSEDDDVTAGADAYTLSFTVSVGSAETETRADGDAIDVEDKVNTIDLWLFPANADEATAKATLHLSYSLTAGNMSQTGKVVSMNNTIISQGTINTLFPDASTNWCTVYAVANLPTGVSIDKDATLDEIKDTYITEDFTKAPTSFVMTGQSDGSTGNTITKGKDAKTGKDKLTGNINLSRVASKITFTVSKVEKQVVDANGTNWYPDLVGNDDSCTMNLAIHNAVKKAQVGTDDRAFATADYYDISGANVKKFDIKTTETTTTGDDGSTTTTTTTTYPLKESIYSYPSDWGRNTNPTEECYLELMVPWKSGEGNDTRRINTYYQIPVGNILKDLTTGTTQRLEKLGRNYHYNISVEVGIIGSFEPAESVILDASYVVLDWDEEIVIGVNMKEVNYLTVNPTEVTMDNVATGSVSYITSHDLVMDDTKERSTRITEISFYDYSSSTIQLISMKRDVSSSGEVTRSYSVNGSQQQKFSSDADFKYSSTTPTPSYNIAWTDFQLSDDGKGTLTLTGKSVEQLKSLYVPYTVTVNISNGRKGVSDQTVTFTQYPPIYIVGEKSNGYVWVNGYSYNSGNTYAYDDSQNFIGTAGTKSGMNQNFTNYAIHISSLSDGTFSIGDTRGAQNNLSNLSKLTTSYRPTREDLEDTNLMLPPSYLFASSCGATRPVTYENAKKRCAAYQENGYPAGRWRVPTLGEIKFAVMLSQAGVFPMLFGSSTTEDSNYWYANSDNKYYLSASQTTSSQYSNEVYVRCVYDLWYWGDDRQDSWKTNNTWSD